MPRRRPLVTALAVAAAAGVGLLAFGEVQAWRASRADYPRGRERGEGPIDGERTAAAQDPGAGADRDVVLVLGFRSRDDGGLNALQAWRTRIARRSAPAGALFVFTGGAVRGDRPEAEVMARYAVDRLGIHPADVAIEPHATSTHENLTLSLPWLTDARTIRIASNTAHARRARQYLRDRDVTLRRRLRPTRDFVPLELGPLRLALTWMPAVVTSGPGEADDPPDREARHRLLGGLVGLGGPEDPLGRRAHLGPRDRVGEHLGTRSFGRTAASA